MTLLGSNGATVLQTLPRRKDWAARLSEFISDSREEGACCDWEYFNCISWACDGAMAMTDVDLYEEFRGRSRSIASAYRMIHRAGFNSLDEIIASKLPTIHPAMARRGDFALVPVTSWYSPGDEGRSGTDFGTEKVPTINEVEGVMPSAVGIVDGSVVWCLTESGLIAVPITESHTAFKIGE